MDMEQFRSLVDDFESPRGYDLPSSRCDSSTADSETRDFRIEGIDDVSQPADEEPRLWNSVERLAPEDIPLPFGILSAGAASAATKGVPLAPTQHATSARREKKGKPPSRAPVLSTSPPLGEPAFVFRSECFQQANDNVGVAPCRGYVQRDTSRQDSRGDSSSHVASEKRGGKSTLQRQFQKTKFCRFYRDGECHAGDSCSYAHTADELQALPSLHKTKLCSKFFRQQCFKKDCNFAHGYEELKATDNMYKITYCRWFARNSCRAGANCRFAHSADELRTATPL
eukprot:TRINITY_DN32872_c0_g1_i1.p1 TRINITY_DN32872_c0_g1~~TRINITY_DN32872_c0_g1_i1.p1  ORF type:complete len:298 (+),score=39.34 TRINITY_DN32872_c0_g1_i1:43-894(+)